MTMTTCEIPLSGLTETVDILIDPWGIAHIRAENSHDLFFAQGFNAARDRLWQIDLWRKRGLGLLAADFGPGYLEQDRAARLFLYRGEMAAEWAAYGDDAEEICSAFVAGINARIGEIDAGRAELPEEFKLMGTQPQRWKAEDVVRIRSHCLTRNAISEVVRANVLARSGRKVEALRKELLPPVEPVTAEDLDLGEIPLSVLRVFQLATAPVSFTPERLAATLEEAHLWTVPNPLGDVLRATESEGSNNWAISPERSATGRPIMATDPHRVHTVPSVRYLVHLTMPGFDAIGGGEPAVPGISLGHNEHFAFSLTIFGGDQEDVFVYELDPADRDRYRYGDGFEPFTEVRERFEVKGHPAQERALRFTRHGPVIAEIYHRAFAVRTVWSEPGTAPYMASLKVMRSKDHAGYLEALENWGTPSVNHLYAGTDGTIGWQASGATPIRPNWNGLLPVPGDGRFEWAGYLTQEELPSSINPSRGFIATANEMNLPEGWSETGSAIGYEWIDKSRSERLHDLLDRQRPHSLAQSCALQNDQHSAAAVRALRVVSALTLKESDALRAQALLTDWDGYLDAGSAPGALFELWIARHLTPALARAFGVDEGQLGLLQPHDIQSVLNVLERPEDWCKQADAATDLRAIVEQTLRDAWQDASARLGSNASTWRWGDLHGLTLHHPLERLFPEQADHLSLPRMELGGGGSSPNYAAYRSLDFETVTGPSMRMVIDVGDWDNSLFVNMPGQSGDPASPHYRDLVPDWHAGSYHPLYYSRPEIERVAETRIQLVPT